MTQPDIKLIAHLMRRAGFGATREEIDACAARGYEATVEDLLDPKDTEWLGDDMVRRFDLEASGMINAARLRPELGLSHDYDQGSYA